MKKLLGLLGTISISASGGSAALAVGAEPNIQTVENKSTPTFNNPENDVFSQISSLKKTYDVLTENEKINFANEMAKLPELNPNKIDQFLENSNVDFIRNNKKTIGNMFFIYSSVNQFSSISSSTFLSLENIDWIQVNKYFNLNFGDSNDYAWKVSNYGPSAWWKFWEWGWRIDAPEGALNYIRLIKFAFSHYNLVNFDPLERLLESAKNIFDYLANIEQHKSDQGLVLYDMLVKITNEFKSSGIPLTKAFYDNFYSIISDLDEYEIYPGIKIAPKNFSIEMILEFARKDIEKKLKMTIEEFGSEFSGITDEIIKPLKEVKKYIDLVNSILPGVAWALIYGALKPISNQMVNADQNHNGVYIKFQQFVIPLGFKAR